MHAVGSGIVARLRTFWPMLAGIICARTALIVACYGSYSSTDNGIFTDGAMLVVCGIFAALLLVLWRTKRNLPENVVQVVFAVSVAVAAGCSIALSLVDSTDETVLAEGFVLSVVSTLALSLCMFYWLRNLRGADEVTAALFVFAAFMVSVAVVYLLSFLPTRAQNIAGAVLIVAQLVLVGPAAARRDELAGRGHRRARTFFTFARSHMQDSRFLGACTLGMGALSFVDGFLRGYPDGLPIAFTPATRAAYSLLAIVVCALMVVLVVRRRERVMTVAIFVVMELLASLGLVLFGAFPFHWEIGAVAVNTLNIVICAYCFYVIIAFTSFGTRDPYLYAMGGWVVCFGVRSVGRMLLYLVYPLTGNDILVNSVLGALILMSAQVVLIQFLMAEHDESSSERELADSQSAEALGRAQEELARREEALNQARETLAEAVRASAEQRSADQMAAMEALAIARAQRCIRCTEGCSPQSPVQGAPDWSGGDVARAAGEPGCGAEAGGALPSGAGNAAEAQDGAGVRLSEQGMHSSWAAGNRSPSAVAAAAPAGRSQSLGAGAAEGAEASGGIMATLSDSMRRSVQQMGEQFLLSDREMDVLTLYALGHTQKKVADELYITPATAHTHIKRIYAKCGMHSRQEILEYLESYSS